MDELDRILASDDPLVPSARLHRARDDRGAHRGGRGAAVAVSVGPFRAGRRCLRGRGGVHVRGFCRRRGAERSLEELAQCRAPSEALVVAVVSVSVAEVFRLRARADF